MRLMKWLGVIAALGVFGYGLGLGLSSTALPDLRQRILGALGEAPGGKAWAQRAPSLGAAAGGSRRHTVVVDVARAVSPGVVSIGVTKTTYVRQFNDFGADLFFSPYIIEKSRQEFPYLGSGFIIDKQGHVITNWHVVEDATSINVTLTDKRTYPAKLLDADRYVDVALLKIQGLKAGEDLPTIPLGNSEDIMIGESVLAVGNPFGPLIADPRPSVSVGVVSAVKRSFKAEQVGRVYQDMIQSDAAINPGNSGGPLVNLDGEVIGINTFIFSQSGTSAGVGFSIPINRAMKVVNEIIRYGRVRTFRLGFEFLSLTPYIIRVLGLPPNTTGTLVQSVDSDGPAARAGLEPGDVIVRADDKEITDASDLLAYFFSRTVGEAVRLRVNRGGQGQELNYKIVEGGRQ